MLRMKNLTLSFITAHNRHIIYALLIAFIFTVNASETDKNDAGVSLSGSDVVIIELDELATKTSDELKSLDNIRDKLSKELVLYDALLEGVLNGSATRSFGSCTASCARGGSVTCSGDYCIAIDDSGCQGHTDGQPSDIKGCPIGNGEDPEEGPLPSGG